MIRWLIISILCFFVVASSHAQGLWTTSEQKFQQGVASFSKGQDKKALNIFKSLIIKSPRDLELYSKIGEFYFSQNRFMDAVYYFEMGSRSSSDGLVRFSLPLARAYFRAGLTQKAGAALMRFPRGAGVSPTVLQEVDLLKRNIDFARLISYHTYNVVVENLRWPINSALDEYAPSFSPLDRDLVFSRKNNGLDENFFKSHLDSCSLWGDASDMGAPLNTVLPESYQNRSFSNKYLIYQKGGNRSVNGWERGGTDLYLAYITDSGWSEPRPFGYTINTTDFEGMPSLSADETVLYFVSDRPGGFGGKDIWKSEFFLGKWKAPVNLGEHVNTAGDEVCPVIAADGKTLFFSSNGHEGFGGFDIFSSEVSSAGMFSKVENIGSPINTYSDDLAGAVTLDGRSIFFASDRDGGYGGLDIYKAEIPQRFQAQNMGVVYGTIKDKAKLKPILDSDIKLTALSSLKVTDTLKGNKGDGSFYLVLPKGATFALGVDQPYFHSLADTFTVNLEKDFDTLSLTLESNGSEIVNDKTIDYLLELNFKQFSVSNEDSICIEINKTLQPYSGKFVIISIDSYYSREDIAILENFLNGIRQCFYKMGVSDENLLLQNWLIGDTSEIGLGENKEHSSGKTILKVEYYQE